MSKYFSYIEITMAGTLNSVVSIVVAIILIFPLVVSSQSSTFCLKFEDLDQICRNTQIQESNLVCNDISSDLLIQKQEYESCMIEETGRLLQHLWQTEEFCAQTRVFYRELLGNLNSSVLLSIYANTIDKLYFLVRADILNKHIEAAHQQEFDNSLELTLNAQMYLYWKFMMERNVNDVYVLNMAFTLYKLQSNANYAFLSDNIKRRLLQARQNLPSTLQYLLFADSFCLLNKHYSEFIYTTNAINLDSQRRYDFMYRKANYVASKGRWLRNLYETSTGYKVNFLSYDLDMYLYMDSSLNNTIMAWRDGTAPDNSLWSMQLVDNQLIFEQNNYLMCGSEQTKDSLRRYVYGFSNSEYTVMSEACQWIAKECP